MFPPPPVPSQARSPSFCPPCLPDYRPTSGGAGLFSLHICVPSPSPPHLSIRPFVGVQVPHAKKKKRKEKRHKTTQVSRPTNVVSVPVCVPRRNRKKSERNCDLELIDNGTSCPSIRRWPHHVTRQSQSVSTLKKKVDPRPVLSQSVGLNSQVTLTKSSALYADDQGLGGRSHLHRSTTERAAPTPSCNRIHGC